MFGFRRKNTWILIIVALIVVAAIVGGSVGGSMAIENSVSKNEQAAQPSAPATPTISAMPTNAVTLTNSVLASGSTPAVCIPSTAASVVRIDTSCPPSLVAWDSKRYTCTEDRNIKDSDINSILAYSLQQCLDACSTWDAVHGLALYQGIAIGDDLPVAYNIKSGANCWLKNDTTYLATYTQGQGGNRPAIAVLHE